MKLLVWLTDAFINTFGITRPQPAQERRAQFLIGGFLLAVIVLVAAITTYFFFALHAGGRH